MIACLCRAVTDRTIAQAVRDGARTQGQITSACGAGGSCGCCRPTIRAILQRTLQESHDPSCDATPTSVAA